MPSFVTILNWAGRAFLATLLFVIGAALIVTVIFLIVPEELSSKWKMGLYGSNRSTVPNSAYVGLTEEYSVRDWVKHCVTGNSLEPLPKEIELLIAPYSASQSDGQARPGAASIRKPNNQEMNILQLSRTILGQRQDLFRTVDSSYSSLQIIQLTIILIGLVTTILVSVSSTEFGKGDTSTAKTIRILAIVFPALGTAAAALNSFYSPRDEMTRASHTLASLAQLHGQIAVGIWSVACATDMTDSKDFKVILTDWGKRYQDILTVGDATSSSGDRSAGGQPVKTGN